MKLHLRVSENRTWGLLGLPRCLIGGLGVQLSAQVEAFLAGQHFHVTVKIKKQREKARRCRWPALPHEGVGGGQWVRGALRAHRSCLQGRLSSQGAVPERSLRVWPSGLLCSVQSRQTEEEAQLREGPEEGHPSQGPDRVSPGALTRSQAALF